MDKPNEGTIAILVIASRGAIYDQFVTKYWVPMINYANVHMQHIKIYLLYGSDSVDGLNIPQENTLRFPEVQETLRPGVLIKTIKAFEYIRGLNVRYVFRTNLSSFLILDSLSKLSDTLPTTSVYCGKLLLKAIPEMHLKHYTNAFVSGAGIWLTPDTMERVINELSPEHYELHYDDVLIGSVLENCIKDYNKRYDLIDNQKRTHDDVIKEIQQQEHYHVRLKNAADRSLDIYYAQLLTNYFYTSAQIDISTRGEKTT